MNNDDSIKYIEQKTLLENLPKQLKYKEIVSRVRDCTDVWISMTHEDKYLRKFATFYQKVNENETHQEYYIKVLTEVNNFLRLHDKEPISIEKEISKLNWKTKQKGTLTNPFERTSL